jgi:transposase
MLGVEMNTTIITLFKKGYNKTQIANMLKVDRKTVRNVLNKIDENGVVERKKTASILDEYKEYIDIQVAKDLTAKRIFQDLQRDFDYTGSYDTVKKYVSKIKKVTPKPYMVLNTLPGEESQVDFGYIGTLNVNGKRKKSWVFVMTLSYSRYMYIEIVFNQSVKTFIECHKNAFRYFGGVPETVKIDNLKAAILEADFYEPTVQKNYAAFAAHYGFWAQPCRVRTPTDKGKVESNVNYVKDNCFKNRYFENIDEATNFAREWLDTIANVRKHGTTKKVPIEVFKSVEKEKLLALPIEDFILSHSVKCTVNTNCHISYDGNYYSAPYAYIGQEVNAIVVNGLIKIYFNEKEIALHSLWTGEKGNYITNNEHYPHSKNISSEDILSRQREEMKEIGVHALEFFEKFIQQENIKKYDYRSISGVLSLRKHYSNKLIDNACLRAISYDAYSYKIIKRICEKGIIDLPIETNASYINEYETDVSRSLNEYDKLITLGELK